MTALVTYFQKGGPVMWGLLVTALVGIAYIIERFIAYTLASIDTKKFLNELKNVLRMDGTDAGIEFCEKYRQPVAKILKAGLIAYKKAGPDKSSIEEAISHAGTDELAFVDRGLPVLAAVASVAPVLGFLGTVTGMIRAFNAVAIAGEVEPTLVASGISEALITTATGLIIAAPVLAFHVYFTTRSNNYAREMESAATELVMFLLEERPR